ncbi:SigB/SigF/SigG family RNA polymerase sigma factor [Streptomyces sp. P6-2-1]|uniref:RNA polymerase sigma factor SigF n=1 Tax=Streptomyces sp. P6-2-1 TaxID=3422591 RepID=UPI003D360446
MSEQEHPQGERKPDDTGQSPPSPGQPVPHGGEPSAVRGEAPAGSVRDEAAVGAAPPVSEATVPHETDVPHADVPHEADAVHETDAAHETDATHETDVPHEPDTAHEPDVPHEPDAAHDEERAPGESASGRPGHHRARGARESEDRSEARALFVRLRTLEPESAAYAELRNRLVRMHLPLVEHLARRFRNRGEPLDDLTQVATIGLIKSVDRFDPERGVEFSTYATPTVVGEIKRHFRDKGWAVRVPRRLQELRLSLTSATAELSQQHGRSPTVHELAQRLSISEEEVLEGLESANAYSTLSLDVPDTDDESPAVADTLGAEDEALEGVEYRESLKPLLEDLPPREKRILLLRFFGNMTQSQIAQEVGISQMHVSRLLARTLAQLREKLLVEE